jgi:hypothetical protein
MLFQRMGPTTKDQRKGRSQSQSEAQRRQSRLLERAIDRDVDRERADGASASLADFSQNLLSFLQYAARLHCVLIRQEACEPADAGGNMKAPYRLRNLSPNEDVYVVAG